jgi:hypothetical protein
MSKFLIIREGPSSKDVILYELAGGRKPPESKLTRS